MKKITLISLVIILCNYASAQIVTIPDANFKAYLVGNAAINTNSDSEIQVSEATAFNGSINCNNLNITDLTGIEEFSSIISLECKNNGLTSVNVSNNTSLIVLSCSNNNLTSLDLSNNTQLIQLDCNNNSISTLDVSNNNLLDKLYVNHNQLSSLDVTSNTALTKLRCYNNQLTQLNVANGNNTNFTEFLAQNNPNLTCIQADDAAYSTTNWTDIDAGASFSEDCSVLVSSITVQGQGGVSSITTNGGTLQMEASVLPNNASDATYTWSVTNGTGSATIDANGLLTAITDGTVTVTATANDGSGVTGDAIVTISNQSSTGINEFDSKNITIYPNPVNNQLIINSDIIIDRITIINTLGKTIKTINPSNNSIDVSSLTKGIYYLQIQTDRGLMDKKFIKK